MEGRRFGEAGGSSLVLRLPVEFEGQEVEWLCSGSGRSAGLSSGGSGRGAHSTSPASNS